MEKGRRSDDHDDTQASDGAEDKQKTSSVRAWRRLPYLGSPRLERLKKRCWGSSGFRASTRKLKGFSALVVILETR